MEMREKIAEFLAKDTGLDYRDANFLGDADQILALIKEAGYVKLADDQGLPEPEIEKSKLSRFGKNWYTTGYMECRGEMLKSGFRRVEL